MNVRCEGARVRAVLVQGCVWVWKGLMVIWFSTLSVAYDCKLLHNNIPIGMLKSANRFDVHPEQVNKVSPQSQRGFKLWSVVYYSTILKVSDESTEYLSDLFFF